MTALSCSRRVLNCADSYFWARTSDTYQLGHGMRSPATPSIAYIVDVIRNLHLMSLIASTCVSFRTAGHGIISDIALHSRLAILTKPQKVFSRFHIRTVTLRTRGSTVNTGRRAHVLSLRTSWRLYVMRLTIIMQLRGTALPRSRDSCTSFLFFT